MRSRVFLKAKLMHFHRGSKGKPTLSSSSASVGRVTHQDYVMAQPKPNKVTFVVADNNNSNRRDLVSQLEDIYGIATDESVDAKASIYISTVQERWKLERLNSERMKLQDM